MADGAAGDPSVLDTMADDFFPFPHGPLVHWTRFVAEEKSLAPGPAVSGEPSPALHAARLDVPFDSGRGR